MTECKFVYQGLAEQPCSRRFLSLSLACEACALHFGYEDQDKHLRSAKEVGLPELSEILGVPVLLGDPEWPGQQAQVGISRAELKTRYGSNDLESLRRLRSGHHYLVNSRHMKLDELRFECGGEVVILHLTYEPLDSRNLRDEEPGSATQPAPYQYSVLAPELDDLSPWFSLPDNYDPLLNCRCTTEPVMGEPVGLEADPCRLEPAHVKVGVTDLPLPDDGPERAAQTQLRKEAVDARLAAKAKELQRTRHDWPVCALHGPKQLTWRYDYTQPDVWFAVWRCGG